MDDKSADPIIEAVVGKMRARSALGLVKYGTTLAASREDTLAFLRHTQAELMDGANYIEVLIQRIERGDDA